MNTDKKNTSTDVLSFNYENSSNNVMGEILNFYELLKKEYFKKIKILYQKK